jgi:hypothetical protein
MGFTSIWVRQRFGAGKIYWGGVSQDGSGSSRKKELLATDGAQMKKLLVVGCWLLVKRISVPASNQQLKTSNPIHQVMVSVCCA